MCVCIYIVERESVCERAGARDSEREGDIYIYIYIYIYIERERERAPYS